LFVDYLNSTFNNFFFFNVFPVVPNKLGKVMESEAKQMMLVICLEMLNIEWGQIDPKGNRRVIEGKLLFGGFLLIPHLIEDIGFPHV